MEDGLFMASQSQFDLFLLDFNLSDGNAFELLETVKEITETNDKTPVILMSSEMSDEMRQNPAAADIGAFLPKSTMTFEGLTAAVRNALKST